MPRSTKGMDLDTAEVWTGALRSLGLAVQDPQEGTTVITAADGSKVNIPSKTYSVKLVSADEKTSIDIADEATAKLAFWMGRQMKKSQVKAGDNIPADVPLNGAKK